MNKDYQSVLTALGLKSFRDPELTARVIIASDIFPNKINSALRDANPGGISAMDSNAIEARDSILEYFDKFGPKSDQDGL